MPGFTRKMVPVPDHGEQSYKGSGRLAGKKAIITGGDSGIGRAVAVAFAREGADVLISYLSEHEDAQETKRLVEDAGRKAVLLAGDIKHAAHCRAIVDKAVSALGGVDILVNNAAHQASFKELEDISEEEWELTFKVNIHAMFLSDQGRRAPHEAGQRHHQHRVDQFRHAQSQTVFTRFITPQSPGDVPGMWQCYYSRWRETTRERINPALLELLPPLSSFSPPATIIDKTKFSGFAEPQLLSHLQARDADGLVITGSETDVCVLGTVLGAVDVGYRVIIVRDAICSSSDRGHDALMEVYHSRFSEQI